VNSDLVGKFVNLASRASGFAGKHFNGALDRGSRPAGATASMTRSAALDSIRRNYRENDFAAACREAMRVCDLLNQRWDEAKPWLLAKDPAKLGELQQVCSECLLGFYVVACALLPILPDPLRARAGAVRAQADEWDCAGEEPADARCWITRRCSRASIRRASRTWSRLRRKT
jgi:methionyl-tRNA synthetase